MKILVSSKGFSQAIKNIDFDSVSSVGIDDKKYFTIHFGRMESFTIPVESKDVPSILTQQKVRWDWLYRDVKGIQEQPIVIEFGVNKATIVLNY